MGVAFRYDIATGTYTKLVDFSAASGSYPQCDIMEATVPEPSGIASASATQVLVYVDAATNQLSVSGYQLSGRSTIEIYDALGRNVFQTEIHNQKSEFDLSSFMKGIYFVQLRNNEQTITRKIILSK